MYIAQKVNGLFSSKSLLLLLLFLLSFSIKSQVNLVTNPSFEFFSSCPSNYNQIKLCTSWDTLKSGGGCGPEYFNECANPNINVGVPINAFAQSYQIPRTGKAYSLMTWFVNFSNPFAEREYIQTKLTQTLTANKSYCVTFYVNLSNRSKYGIDRLSAYLDDGSVSGAFCKAIVLTPQIQSQSGIYFTDTLNWMKVQGSFVATGQENYITIGNFNSTAATNYVLANASAPSSSQLADYYIDDVSVIELNLPAYAGPDKTIMLGDSTFIGRPPEIGLECTWYNGTVNIGTGAGIWVKPAVTTTYVVQQDICGLIKTDTVNVIVNYVGINENFVDSKFVKLYPNPTNGEFTLESTYANIELKEVEITDVAGRTVFKKDLNSRKTNLQPNLNNGIYFITLRVSNNETVTKKLIVTK